MSAASILRYARRRANLTQRDLANRSAISQTTITRIESGRQEPRFGLLQGLLRECGQHLVIEDRPGVRVDHEAIRELLMLSPRERLDLLVASVQDRSDFDSPVDSSKTEE